jgi:transcription initiation factor IIE alpha subunit
MMQTMAKPHWAMRSPKWSPFYQQFRDTTMQYGLWMDKHEREVALFIFQRTRVYGEDMKHIPLRQFLQGVWNSKDGCICPKLRMNKQALLAALKHLENKRIIEIERDHHTNHYALRPYERANEPEILTYIAEHQPSLLRVIRTELRLNRHRLAPAMREVLAKIEEHDGERINIDPANATGPRNANGSESNQPLVRIDAHPGSKQNLLVDRTLLISRKKRSFPVQSTGVVRSSLLKQNLVRIPRLRTRLEG